MSYDNNFENNGGCLVLAILLGCIIPMIVLIITGG